MQFQWYPGHMTKAKRQMQEDIKLIDLVIELVDARIPLSSRNPDIDELGKNKARLILMNKSDLADEQVTAVVMEACKEKIERDRKRGIMNRPVRAMVVGIPNVGKSTFINRIAGEERAIVSDIAGTTRDATDTIIENEDGKYVFIDTAGIRRKSKITEKIEHYSVLRAYMAVDRADVCVIVIDALVGFTDQDSKVAGYAHEQGKACIVAVNKWDAVDKSTGTMEEYTNDLKEKFSFMSYVPFIFISAKTGQRVDKLFELINSVNSQNCMRITTGMLNDVLSYATTRVQPPSDKGRRLKIYYMTQASVRPPTFVVFVNRADLFHFSYQRYIENQIRQTFGLTGTPVRFVIRERDNQDTK